VLRIEDTDLERSTEEFLDDILGGLEWLGLDWDEGPIKQTSRTAEYKRVIEKLLAQGKAYRCTCKQEELAAKREKAKAAKETYLYDGTCRDKNHGPDCGDHVVRLKMPKDGVTTFNDLIKKDVSFANNGLDDWIIARTDQSPTYNFCVVVDDAQMEISHVIRGDDHLTNTFKQVHVYEALEYKKPVFVHMPLIHGKDGGKLSKRHGATSVTTYRDMGYLPIAMRNYLARLGWAHGDQEIFSDKEMIEHFDPADLSKSSSTFDMEKFNWVNAQHMRGMPPEELAKYAIPMFQKKGYDVKEGRRLYNILKNFTGRTETLVEMVDWSSFLFVDDFEYNEKAAKKFLRPVVLIPMTELRNSLFELDDFSEENIGNLFEALCQKHEIKLGKIAQPVRVAVTGISNSPGINETLALVGKDRVIKRLDRALDFIKERAKASQ